MSSHNDKRYPSTGLYDTMRRYYDSSLQEQQKMIKKRKSLVEESSRRDDAIRRFVEISSLSAVTTTGRTYSMKRHHLLHMKGKVQNSRGDAPKEKNMNKTEDKDKPDSKPPVTDNDEQKEILPKDSQDNNSANEAAENFETSNAAPRADEKSKQKENENVTEVYASAEKQPEDEEKDKNETEDKDDEKNFTTEKVEDIITIDLSNEDLKRYEQYKIEQQEAMNRMETAKKQVRKDQVDLWGVYKYGLNHVLGLNDLAGAPDAILPGNF